MAIKFSELKPLMKETSIQTVKMSDSVYGIYMECMTHYEKGNNMVFDEKKNITFKNINNLKNKNRLYEVYYFAPLLFILSIQTDRYDSWSNIQVQLNKKGLNNILNEAMSQSNLDKHLPKSNSLRLRSNVEYLLSCIQTNNSATVFKNCFLFQGNGLFAPPHTIDTMPILQWYNGKWNNMNIKNTVILKLHDKYKVRYYNEYTDKDENSNSGVILYTSKFSIYPSYGIMFYFVFMATDKINQRYIPTQLRYNTSIYTQGGIRKIGEENHDNLKDNIYYDLYGSMYSKYYPYTDIFSKIKEE